MRNNHTYTFMFASLLFFACQKKDLPQQQPADPVFKFEGNVNQQAVKLYAGDDGYYMYPSFYQDSSSSLSVYKADLCNAPTGGRQLIVLINGSRFTQGGQKSNVDSALAVGPHVYNDVSTQPLSYKVALFPEQPNMASSSFTWTISDGQTTRTYNSYTLGTQLDAGKKYNISLHFDDGLGGCNLTHTNEFRIGNAVQAKFDLVRDLSATGFKYTFSSKPNGTPPFSYSWDFGDGSALSSEVSPVHSYANQNTPYRAKLQVTDANKDTCITYYQVLASTDNVCQSNFKVSITPVLNSKALSSVTVLYRDENNVLYSTKGFLQPADSYFNIVAPSETYTSSNGLATRKVIANFNCVLKNGSNSISIKEGKATIAVAIE